ncbi:MAG: hypothetical protein WA717_01140 [Methyloceanibacter sp.]|jgi:hypothetical protein
MLKSIRLAVALGLCATDFAFAADDDDDKVPAAEVTKVEDTLSTLGCNGL